MPRWEPAQISRRVAYALTQGLDVAFHATEVEELEAALVAIRSARREVNPRTLENVVCRIEHGGLIPDGYPEHIAALGVWVVTNPGFIYYRGPKYADDPGLAPWLYRARSLLDAGVQVAAGTDAPVTPGKPLTAIVAAATLIFERRRCELGPAEKNLAGREVSILFTRCWPRLSRLSAGEIAPGRLCRSDRPRRVIRSRSSPLKFIT